MSQVTQVQLRNFPYLFVLHNGELGCLNLNQYFELDFVSLKFWTRLRVVQGFRLSVNLELFDSDIHHLSYLFESTNVHIDNMD